ncbi:uncharacterized protein LOC103522312 [Diaphorina citri]|uniref:Uncharacterized protein LOC103522312 n=1 Tax=Diaphorina citri TaxID=121845 RepID=A0A1S3DPQ3_DIACI|nr:uncharacterized protein LOC103522312 [Diaphorina citri]
MANRALASTTPTPPAISSIPSFNKPSSPVPSSRSGLNSTPPPRRNSTSNDEPSTNGTHANSNGHGNLYEHLFLASDPPNGSSLPAETSVTSQANNSARSRPVTRTTVNPQPNRPGSRTIAPEVAPSRALRLIRSPIDPGDEARLILRPVGTHPMYLLIESAEYHRELHSNLLNLP